MFNLLPHTATLTKSISKVESSAELTRAHWNVHRKHRWLPFVISKFGLVWFTLLRELSIAILPPNNSAMLCSILLKFNMLVHYGNLSWLSCEKSLRSNQRWRTAPDFQYLNRYNSSPDCSISLKFGTMFDHVTTDTLHRFKVKESKVKVTAWRNVSAEKRYKSGTHIKNKLTEFNLVKLIPLWSATCDTCSRSKGQRSRSHCNCPPIADFKANFCFSRNVR